MHDSRTITAGALTRQRNTHRRSHRGWLIALAAVVLVVVVAAEVGGRLMNETMRQRLEANMNRRLSGYTAHLAAVDLHPLSFSLTLRGLDVRQNAHPKPSVIVIETLHDGVHWRALLHLRLVADFGLDGMQLHINRPQLLAEANDSVRLKDKGWQEALESIYPLKINQFRVTNAALTYVDDDPKRPLEITHAALVRNAFFKAILPGFDKAVRAANAGGAAASAQSVPK